MPASVPGPSRPVPIAQTGAVVGRLPYAADDAAAECVKRVAVALCLGISSRTNPPCTAAYAYVL